MRFVFLDSWIRSRAEGSGSAVAIAGLASGLRGLGHSVELIVPSRHRRSLAATRLHYNLTLGRRVANGTPFDYLVGFDYDGWALPMSAKQRYVVSLKGVAADERRFETGWNRLRFAVWSGLEGRNARSATRVVVTSEYSRRQAIDAYRLDPAQVRIVPEGFDEVIARTAGLEGGTGAAGAPPVVLSVARQYRRKDTATLIRAVPDLVRMHPDARVRIVGSGPELDRLQRLARDLELADVVTFLGSIDTTALRAEYERATIFCLPTRQEGFGIVFLEAMSHGLPIVAAAAGAVPEVAPHDETSLLVAPGDPSALAAALNLVIANAELARRLGDAGIRRARGYTWEASARAFLGALAD